MPRPEEWEIHPWFDRAGHAHVMARGPKAQWSFPRAEMARFKPLVLAAEPNPEIKALISRQLDEVMDYTRPLEGDSAP